MPVRKQRQRSNRDGQCCEVYLGDLPYHCQDNLMNLMRRSDLQTQQMLELAKPDNQRHRGGEPREDGMAHEIHQKPDAQRSKHNQNYAA